MSITSGKCIQALTRISAHPTAPMYEFRVARYILSELARLGLPVRRDDVGNIIAEYVGPNAPESGIALVAHMDHPACEIADPDGKTAWLFGSVRKECFGRSVPVRVFPAIPPDNRPDYGIPGSIVGCEDAPDGRTRLSLELKGTPEMPAFGIWDFPPIEIRADLAYMRAVDDVVGCAAILLVLEELIERQVPCRCYGVFTRAEEIGFLGAVPLARERILPMDTIIVSLETSKALPGAEIGTGPVIRVGDRMSTFDGRAESVLQAAWESMKKESPEVKVQRQLMSGGACEASVFILEGYPTTAMALPLGNYHNVAEDLTLAPEYIHVDDLATQVELLVRATEFVTKDTLTERRKQIHGRADAKLARLKSTYEEWKGVRSNE